MFDRRISFRPLEGSGLVELEARTKFSGFFSGFAFTTTRTKADVPGHINLGETRGHETLTEEQQTMEAHFEHVLEAAERSGEKRVRPWSVSITCTRLGPPPATPWRITIG